jgi:hypothetical protein
MNNQPKISEISAENTDSRRGYSIGDSNVDNPKSPSISLSDRLFAALPLVAASVAWSFVFMRFFNGLYIVKKLFPWIVDANVLMAIVFALGVIIAPLLGILIERRWLPFVEEVFLYSAAHIGLLATIYLMILSRISRILFIGAALAYFAWLVIVPLVETHLLHKNTSIPKPSFSVIVAFLLISLLSLPSTSPIEAQTSNLRPARELQYYIAPIEYSDEESFEVDLRTALDNWDSYSNEEKLERLSMVVEYECVNELGFEAPRLASDDLDEGVAGVFRYANSTIAVDENFLATAQFAEVLDTVLHESRHAYQFVCQRMVSELSVTNPDYLRLTVFREPLELSTEELQYDRYEYEDSWEAYINDPFEDDARNYSLSRMTDYYLSVLVNMNVG